MAPSSKRSQRSRSSRDFLRHSSPQYNELSPTRPVKRRRKAECPLEEESSSVAADAAPAGFNDDQIVSQVAQHLAVARDHPPRASQDHSNTLHQSNRDGVTAYAKIAALDWTFYVTKLAVNIGRYYDQAGAQNEDDCVHIDLSPNKIVSRQHARIYYEPKSERWILEVRGRNGVRVDGKLVKQNESHTLSSGEVVEVGINEMIFVLPVEISPLRIDAMYLHRAGITSHRPSSSSSSARGRVLPPPPPPRHSLPRRRQGVATQLHQQIAPAPPDYKRPGTPPSARNRISAAHIKSPPNYAPGAMTMTSGDLDLSKSENRHLKPPYSYSQLITQAIIHTEGQKLTLNGIYTYIMDNYSYYRHQPVTGWQNSIRHNLSLNKAFEKVARTTQEPGKGMKWHIVPEQYEDMVRVAFRGGRGGHRGSSAPSSPSNFSYVGGETAGAGAGPSRKRKLSEAKSPPPQTSVLQLTPDRSARFVGPSQSTLADGSPLPQPRKTLNTSFDNPPQSPTLTSSYNPEDSFVTPAPQRLHPRLAPPSTAQRPSQHMPISSPAPFWKYADIGSTPLKPAQLDLSPIKPRIAPVIYNSSSPHRADGETPAGSPTKEAVPPDISKDGPAASADESEEAGFDLTKGFQSIGSYHTLAGSTGSAVPAPPRHP